MARAVFDESAMESEAHASEHRGVVVIPRKGNGCVRTHVNSMGHLKQLALLKGKRRTSERMKSALDEAR